jgi:hypothetical protein
VLGKQQQQSVAPHPLTQKFATLLHALLVLSTDAGDDEPVGNSLMRLRSDYEALVTKLSAGITEQWRRERFLGNNYNLVATIIGVSLLMPILQCGLLLFSLMC